MVSHKSKLIKKINLNLSEYGPCSSDFDLNQDLASSQKLKFLEASVLIPVLTFKEELEILLTKRSISLRNHPGQIAFPGGKKEECDSNHMETALREAEEEIGLKTSHVEVISSLPTHKTATGFTIKPYIGLVRKPFKKTLQWGEVDEVFTIPFGHILNRKNFSIQTRKWNGIERRYYIVPFGPYYIWGATARILLNLSEALN